MDAMSPRYLRNIFFFFLELLIVAVYADSNSLAISGSGITTRYWDCCKPSCSWNGKAKFSQPVQTCNKTDSFLADFNAGTGCNGGDAYLCSDQQPWAVNDTFAYGFAGIFIKGHVEDFWCCACYQLDFTSGSAEGKTMIVQASNTAYDVNTANRFSLAVPGGNITADDACAKQWDVSQTVFGAMERGVSSIDDCDNLPQQLRSGCQWRFNWFNDALYPTANFKRVVCPTELTSKTGCVRDDDKQLADTVQKSASTINSPFPVSGLVAAAVMLVTSILWV